ncbi:MFS-type transporter SLC18B1-like [Corticium candelabrum]|uniref:MFS-type transporter SLC18B1-like n=1 Tax=Corticium candelabrum TaxID=121492 RepID=UPI002E26BBC1|nr:MFS-type transporter SLC18B1-like [Corticium candelabrum]
MLKRSFGTLGNRLIYCCRTCFSHRSTDHQTVPVRHHRRHVLILLTFITCMTNASFCILFPFYPQEAAERQGVDNQEKTPSADVGFVLSASSLAYFVFALFSGQWIDSVGAKPIIVWGTIALGASTVVFGFLALTSDYLLFIWLSFIVSVLQGLAGAVAETACFALACREFPDSVGMAVGVLEQGIGVGMMLASPLGGALYSLDGFYLPFCCLGLILLACAALTVIVIDSEPEETRTMRSQPPVNILLLAKDFQISLSASCGVSSAALLGFLDAGLAAYLDNRFELTPAKIGMVFVLSRGLYAFLAPFVGKASDSCGARHILGSGLLVCWIGFFLMVSTNDFWVFVTSQAVIGLGIAMASIPCFADIIAILSSAGHKDSVAVSGVISGVLSASFAMGEGIGSLIGGKLGESLGFIGTGMVFGLVMFFHWITYLTFAICFRPSEVKIGDAESKWEVVNHIDV